MDVEFGTKDIISQRDSESRTPLAKEGELFVAVLCVPTVQPSVVHGFDLKALQLGAEDVVLGRGCLPKTGQTLGWQENLHGT